MSSRCAATRGGRSSREPERSAAAFDSARRPPRLSCLSHLQLLRWAQPGPAAALLAGLEPRFVACMGCAHQQLSGAIRLGARQVGSECECTHPAVQARGDATMAASGHALMLSCSGCSARAMQRCTPSHSRISAGHTAQGHHCWPRPPRRVPPPRCRRRRCAAVRGAPSAGIRWHGGSEARGRRAYARALDIIMVE